MRPGKVERKMVVLGSLSQFSSSLMKPTTSSSSSSSSSTLKGLLSRRRTLLVGPTALVASLLHVYSPIDSPPSIHTIALALPQQDELQQEEDRVVHLFQVFFFFFLSKGILIYLFFSLALFGNFFFLLKLSNLSK